jgi:hypothetical protein
MKTGGGGGHANCAFSDGLQVLHIAHVLVYVNQNENFRVVLNFFSGLFLPLCTFNGSVRRNFRVI